MCCVCSGVCWASYHNREISGGVCWVVLQHLSVCTHTYESRTGSSRWSWWGMFIQNSSRSRCFPTFKETTRNLFFFISSLTAHTTTHIHIEYKEKAFFLFSFAACCGREVCASPKFSRPHELSHICWHF